MDALDLQALIDPSADGDESNVVIPHDFSIGMFPLFPPPFFFSYLDESGMENAD